MAIFCNSYDEVFETDAQPLSPVPESGVRSLHHLDLNENDSSDSDSSDCKLKCEKVLSSVPVEAGDVRVEGSSIEIDKSSVHIGHSIKQKTDINFEKVQSVIVDKSRVSYITYQVSL